MIHLGGFSPTPTDSVSARQSLYPVNRRMHIALIAHSGPFLYYTVHQSYS